LQNAKRLYKAALKDLTRRNIVMDTIREVAEQMPRFKVKIISVPKRSLRASGAETDILCLGDIHGGEVVCPERVMGINEYNVDVMNRRLYHLAKTALYLVNLRRAALDIPRLIIVELGDMVSGEIHKELAVTNLESMTMEAARVGYLTAQLYAYLSSGFERIDSYAIPGNHGRVDEKPSYKNIIHNWDYHVYQWQAVFCRDLPNVHFHIPQGGAAFFKAENLKVVAMHGNEVKGWGGKRMPWYGIQSHAETWDSIMKATKNWYDLMLLGHLHRRYELEKGMADSVIGNGTLKGYDEYAFSKGYPPAKASQYLVWVHNEEGHIGGQSIYVQDPGEEKFEDVLPDVWAGARM